MAKNAPSWKLAKSAPPKAFTVKPSGNTNAKGPSINGTTLPAAPGRHGNTATAKTVLGEQTVPFPKGTTKTK